MTQLKQPNIIEEFDYKGVHVKIEEEKTRHGGTAYTAYYRSPDKKFDGTYMPSSTLLETIRANIKEMIDGKNT